jgi:hypothetical protein
MKFAFTSLMLLLGFAPLLHAAVAPPPAPVGRSIEICFVLDTTGSMTGLIEGAKQKIWSICNDVISTKPTPKSIRIALLPFRDRGDEYITKVFDLTDDIDTVYKNLQTFQAAGGGDEPESVNQALNEAVEKVKWSSDDAVLKVIFLVGDAPPHMDYQDDVKYPDVCKKAVKKNLIINSVQCGSIPSTTPIWKEIAHLSEGSYIQLGQTGDMVAISTPMDAELAELNRKMGTTLVAFGVGGALSMDAVRSQAAKQLASEAAPAAVAADRLSYNAQSGKAVQGDDELIDAIAAKRVALKDLKDDQLPEDLRKLSPTDREAHVAKLTAERAAIRDKIAGLSKSRDEYISAEKKKLVRKGDSFDAEVSKIISEQIGRKQK